MEEMQTINPQPGQDMMTNTPNKDFFLYIEKLIVVMATKIEILEQQAHLRGNMVSGM